MLLILMGIILDLGLEVTFIIKVKGVERNWVELINDILHRFRWIK